MNLLQRILMSIRGMFDMNKPSTKTPFNINQDFAHIGTNYIGERITVNISSQQFVMDAEDSLTLAAGLLISLTSDTEQLTSNFISYVSRVNNGEDKSGIRKLIVKDIDTFSRSIRNINDEFGKLMHNFSHLFIHQAIIKGDLNKDTKYLIKHQIQETSIKFDRAINAINGVVKSLNNATNQYSKAGLETIIIDNCIDNVKKLLVIMVEVKGRFDILALKIR
ncbi:hypothetical protein Haur_5291 (plasmid) [Herpetosiphon aurantiacus DSM 785]|uniref:Uncharacterized protein n=1 Tax=Herpetosiphon aurantiacus (strain ATCC 23779 / DSM 785 / 114-95) TaxID=316274 RepID=A9B9A4_HERA2|nr:hypothetical protein Haur_5291 [Herpetosiphon aurantiacus DSM 785]